MKITKQRLKEIIREELNEANRFPPDMTGRAAHSAAYGDDAPSLGDLQSDEKFTGGTPKEQMIRRIKARELLAAMSREELKDFAMSLDADMVAELRHLLANPMYKPGLEESNAEAQDLIRKAEFEKSKGRLHQGDVDRIKQRLAAGERVHSIKRDYRRNF
jgi:hypothetical protein